MLDLNRRQLLILNELQEKETTTAANLALVVEASVRTVKNDISILKKKLKSKGIEIKSSSNKGYTLSYKDESAKQYLIKGLATIDIKRLNLFKRNNYERIFYIIRALLLSKDYIKLDHLAEQMFISRSTLNQDMPEVKRVLSNYQLHLSSKANYGITITGNELDKRICFAEYFFHNKMTFDNSIELEEKLYELKHTIIPFVEDLLRNICEQNKISLSDFSLKNIAIHVLISIFRSKSGHTIQITQEYEDEVNQVYSTIYRTSKKLCDTINQVFKTNLTKNDIYYISMHLESKQLLQSIDAKPSVLEEVNQVLQHVYLEIKNNFDIDISNDPTLNKYLPLHMLQMIRRIKHRIVLRNPVVHENLQKYLFATKVTVSAVKVIEDYYHINISLDEFGYLVLYFNVALRNLRKRRKITICLISGRGRAETIMYINELKENFPEKNFQLINYDFLDEAMEQMDHIDVLVSSYKHRLPSSIHQVAIEKGNYIEQIKQFVSRLDLFQLDVEKYFKPTYANFYLEGTDKQSILQNIVHELQALGIIEEKMITKMPFISHEIGNNIVHLQDLHKICRKPVCYIAVLKKPIIWDKDIIKVLFLIKTKRDGDHHLPILSDMFSKWTQDKEKVNRLINQKNYDSFLIDLQNY
ncbi:BglG family transcription antiterminator [Paraliobacillus salinarum]|uniref:BglG family transcription antiterminator n=1 Tax=Paraliobacillus salinarum TaxID=1158996 RepID=UPI0015F56409|nr:PRD domain-containing protein [Paraliobacillus salinarum]